MKPKALVFCLSTIVTIGVFTACKKTTDVAPTPEPAKPELSSKDPQALSASLKVYHGERLTGNVPAPSGTNLQLPAGNAYTPGFKGGLAVITPQIDYGSTIAGYYMKVQGATEYFKIDYSKPIGARFINGNKAKHANPFSRGAHADSLSDGNVDSSLIIVLPPNIKVPDTFCVSYCAYDLQGNVSNVITTCIVVNNLGPDAGGAWLNGGWKKTANWEGIEPHDTILYNRWSLYSNFYCKYDSASNYSYITEVDNGTAPIASDSILYTKMNVLFSNNGSVAYENEETHKYVDQMSSCDGSLISFPAPEIINYKDTGAWSYNSITRKMILVGHYDWGSTETELWVEEYEVRKLNDNQFLLLSYDYSNSDKIYYIRFEK